VCPQEDVQEVSGDETAASAGRDYTLSIRPVFFQTELEEFRYATNGGTMFVVEFASKMYGLTCRHVIGDFRGPDMFVGPTQIPRIGDPPAYIDKLAYPKNPSEAAVDSDLLDIALLTFHESITPEFFGDHAYVINRKTVAQSRTGQHLQIFGALKSRTHIDPPNVSVDYAQLDFLDMGARSSDCALRTGQGKWDNCIVADLVGLSGSPVFNKDLGALAGMVVRGGMDDQGLATIHYIDIFDIVQFMQTIAEGGLVTKYEKYPEGWAEFDLE